MAADLRNYRRLDAAGVTPAKSSHSSEQRTKRRPPPPADGTTQMMESPTTVMVLHDNPPVAPPIKKKRRKDLFQRKGILYGVPIALLTLFLIGFLLQINRPRHKTVEQTASTAVAPALPTNENAVDEKSAATGSVPTHASKPVSSAPEQSTSNTKDITSAKFKALPATESVIAEESKKIAEATKAPPADASKHAVKKDSALGHTHSNSEPSHAGNGSTSEKKKTAAKTTAVVSLAVTPWGEIYVDGKQQGISPPLREISLPLGKHIIEVRNTSFPAHKETIDLSATAKIKVKHKFQ